METKSKVRNLVLKAEPIRILFSPFALAIISDDLFKCSEFYKPLKRVPLINYHLYLSSIEKGLKAAILSRDIEGCDKKFLRSKEVSHDLVKVYNKFKELFNISLLTKKEERIIDSINHKYIKKGFEYFDDDMLYQACTAFKDLPKLEDIRKISKKINKFIANKKYFI